MVPARTQAQRSEATREAIVCAARDLFATVGFAASGVEEIARAAGVSKGALYHHFPDKAEVLAAVYESIEADLCERLLAVATVEADPVAALRAGIGAFLDACLDPAIRRIALVEAPGALGWQRWREIDSRYGFGLLRLGLQAAADEGRVAGEHVNERAHVLLAVLIESSLLVGNSNEPETTRAVVGGILDEIVENLTTSPQQQEEGGA